jgi:Zn finger protein HypA/HybF involved in hydrogenase expression
VTATVKVKHECHKCGQVFEARYWDGVLDSPNCQPCRQKAKEQTAKNPRQQKAYLDYLCKL